MIRMDSLFSNATKETINFIYKETQKQKNKQKLESIIQFLSKAALNPIQPYLILIICMLIILFLMNCFQFFYYIKYIVYNRDFNGQIYSPELIDKII